jgi:hypothetical protein
MRLRAFQMVCIGLLAVVLGGCSVIPKELPAQDRAAPKKIAVFLDGTANDEGSDTNVKKLHSLVTLQDRRDISAVYVEGVGASGKVVGMAVGWGIGHRVRLAYSFLLREYRPGDEVYIFGFSRGAYAARILASMLHNVGLPDLRKRPDGTVDHAFVAGLAYDAAFRAGPPEEMSRRLDEMLANAGLPPERRQSVPVKVLGLFDTVEALGLFPHDEDVGNRNARYGDQLCNVERAWHAMSLDDNRATFFTPKLLTRPHLFDGCRQRQAQVDSIVDEVWFSGAHSDVGGGYRDSLLSGVPLNWMIRKLAPTGLLPAGARVRENHLDLARDAEDQHLLGLYTRYYRKLQVYMDPANGALPGQRLKLHASVIDRLQACGRVCPEAVRERLRAAFAWDQHWKRGCFRPLDPGYEFSGEAACGIAVVDPNWRPAAGAGQ